MSYVIAIDPGLTGAVAVMFSGGVAVEVFDIPTADNGKGFVSRVVDAHSLACKLGEYVPRISRPGDHAIGVRVVMERVASMSKQGVASMMSLGDSRGALRGVTQALGVFGQFYEEVSPQVWKRDLDLLVPRAPKGTPKSERDKAKREGKARARAMAQRLFPALAHQLAREKDHGRAEALLIGYWATQRTKGAL